MVVGLKTARISPINQLWQHSMAATLQDILEWLKKQDEISLLELLEINSEEIVDRFIDFIEDKYDSLQEDYEAEREEQQTNSDGDY